MAKVPKANACYKVIQKFRSAERKRKKKEKRKRKEREKKKEREKTAVSTYSFVEVREIRARKIMGERKTRAPRVSGGMNNLRTSDRAIEIHVSGNRFERQITESLSPRPIS